VAGSLLLMLLMMGMNEQKANFQLSDEIFTFDRDAKISSTKSQKQKQSATIVLFMFRKLNFFVMFE